MAFRILVVDDELDVCFVVKNQLFLKGFEVVAATDGFAAIKEATRYRPDVIILDVMMPKMSGFQVCTSLRRRPEFEKTPIIFLTAKDSPQDEAWAKRSGGTHYVTKPFDTRRLASLVEDVCAGLVEIKDREPLHADSRVRFEG